MGTKFIFIILVFNLCYCASKRKVDYLTKDLAYEKNILYSKNSLNLFSFPLTYDSCINKYDCEQLYKISENKYKLIKTNGTVNYFMYEINCINDSMNLVIHNFDSLSKVNFDYLFTNKYVIKKRTVFSSFPHNDVEIHSIHYDIEYLSNYQSDYFSINKYDYKDLFGKVDSSYSDIINIFEKVESFRKINTSKNLIRKRYFSSSDFFNYKKSYFNVYCNY